MAALVSNNNVLSHVPPQLQRLVRLVIRAFYQPEHYIVMDILARYLCVAEADLLQLLKLDPKKLRIILSFLKKDKLIKSVSRMEPVKGLENGEKKSVLSNYYYINYKVFVNVIKYKLDRMRERIQTEERTVSNRTSYVCPNCQNTYSDLDVDRLIDPMEGILRCLMCKSQLEEEAPTSGSVDVRSILSKLNEQLRPILDILREMENVSLAEHILDPEPQSIQNIIEDNKNDKSQSSKGANVWTTNRIEDIYGDQTFTINIGSENEQKVTQKAAPQWMKESTIYDPMAASNERREEEKERSVPINTDISRTVMPGDEIMKLLANEEESSRHKRKRSREQDDDGSSSDEGSDTSSTGSSGDEEEKKDMKSQNTSMSFQDHKSISNSSNEGDSEEEESEDEELILKVGDKVYELGDITPDVIKGMTPAEKDRYTQLYQKAYSNYF